MYQLQVTVSFEATAQLKGYTGVCGQVHPIQYQLTAGVQAEQLNAFGLVMDYMDLESDLKTLVAPWRDQHLNDCEPFAQADFGQPSVEQVARWVFKQLQARYQAEAFDMAFVAVKENDRCEVRYVPSA